VARKKIGLALGLCLFGMLVLTRAGAFADQETYVLEDEKIYRVYADGNRELLEEEFPGQCGTEQGLFFWVVVDPELSEAMEGSERGIYFFDEQENPRGFLPFEGASYCSVLFSPDGERFLLSCGTSVSQEISLYTFEDLQKKNSFQAVGFVEWIDFARFVFSLDDIAKGRRGDAMDQQEGWLSVVVYDTLMEELFPVAEATETKDYMYITMDVEEDEILILERSVERVEDWDDENAIEDREFSVPIPAAG